MSVFVKFLTEPRKEFANSSIERPSALLGSFEASELLIVKKWQQSDEVKAVVTVPYAWLASNILPSEDPTSQNPQLSRARYFVVRDEYGEQIVYHLQSYSILEKTASMAKLELTGGDARVHSHTMTSAPNTSGKDWEGTRTNLLQRLFRRLSNNPAEGMAAWQRLPITALDNSSPNTQEAEQGFMQLQAIEFLEPHSIGSPDPLPIAPALEELYGYMLDYEVAPVPRWGHDGTQSPWWKWMLRGRVSRRALFSESDGSLIVNSTAGSNEQTETMSYSSKDYVQARYASGENQGRTNLRGPWAGFAVDSANPPEGANVEKFLTSRARSATLRNKRVTFDFTLNFSKLGIKPIIGMSTFARIGDLIYRVNVDEIAASYSSESGWLTTAPVFLSQDSVKVASIKDGPYIELVVNTTTNFSIPTNYGAQPTQFRWTVEVDGVFYGEYEGVSAANSNGIPVEFTTPGSHTIRIYDTTGEYKAGWARAFGFYNVQTGQAGAGSPANRNKLTRVNKDPDWGHLLTPEQTGDYFRAYQFYSCSLLTASYREEMPGSVKSIGNNAYIQQYAGCNRLEVASVESMGVSATAIGHNYRSYQYRGCEALQEAAIEGYSAKLLNVGSNFRVEQYSRSGVRLSYDEADLPELKSVGSGFRRAQFKACSSLTLAGRESFPTSCSFDSGFRSEQYRDCTALYRAAEESTMTGSMISGSGFKESQYEGCTALLEAASERASVSSERFRYRQYYGCVALAEVPEENPGVIVRGYFRYQQYAGCISITVAPEERYSSIADDILTHFRSGQYGNCIALLAAAKERFDFTGSTIRGFRVGQYSGCSSLETAADESFNAPNLKRIEGKSSNLNNAEYFGFRSRQYKNCVSLKQPPLSTRGHAEVLELLQGYRDEQFMGCSMLLKPQEEVSINSRANTSGFSAQGGIFNSQYEGCIALVSAPAERVYYTGSWRYVSGPVRTRQFFGCVSLEKPAEESPDSNNQLSLIVDSNNEFRVSQYEGCTSLKETAKESQHRSNLSPNATVNVKYRTAQYRGCSSLLPSSFTQPKLETTLRSSTATYSAAFRGNQFQDTPASNVAGNRVKFSDGVEAVPGVNVPNDIY